MQSAVWFYCKYSCILTACEGVPFKVVPLDLHTLEPSSAIAVISGGFWVFLGSVRQPGKIVHTYQGRRLCEVSGGDAYSN